MATVAAPYAPPLQLGDRRLSLVRWISTVDHKDIGTLYLLGTLLFFIIGGIEALLIRIQLAVPNNHFLSPQAYNAAFTMHGTTMIFLVVMPMLLGFANYVVPLQIGARDMAFPRLNAFSLWLFFLGGLLLNFSFFTGNVPDQGWFAYAPLTEKPFTMTPSIDYWILGLLVTSIGTIITGINFIVTVVKLRAPGMSFFRMPLMTWMTFADSFIIIWAIPALTAAQLLLLFDRYLGTHFFNVASGGDALLWEHLFWYFGHPEVYIMVLPAFGMISEIIPVFSRKPLFGYPVVVASGAAIAFLSFGVWAHHMFTVGLGQFTDSFFALASMLIAVPTGIKIFNWLATLWGGKLRFSTPMLFCLGFLAMFTMGGITGVQFATTPIDWQVTDSYYVVAHFHYVLFGGTYFAMSGGAYYWFPKMTGRMLSEKLGKWHFWLTLFGFNMTFLPMHIVGLMGMTRRTYTYPNLPWWGAINFEETIGAFVLAASVLVLIWNVWVSLHDGEVAGPNPWNAWTLEWATSSPPPPENFSGSLPPIRSARPLYDLAHATTAAATAGSIPTVAPGAAAPAARVHAAPPRERESFLTRMPTEVLGTLTFISSEAIFFGSLIATFLVGRLGGTSTAGIHEINVGRTALFSIALFASSGTIIFAERRLRARDQRGFRLGLLATIILGATFLYGQVTEYLDLYAHNFTTFTSPFSGGFFTLTGFHGFHVLVGLIALTVVAGLAFFADQFAEGKHHTAFEAVAFYWHFVDAVWVVVFTVVYLGSLL